MRCWALGAIFVLLLASRLAHLRIVWVEEGYPAAAAVQVLDYGKVLYRDVWFDKPPGTVYLYCLWGARTGLTLRLADSVFLFACCLALFAFGRSLWSEREGLAAAATLAIYLTFGIPSAVMAIAPDLALVLPHILSIYLASQGRAWWAGVVAGVGFWFHTKALFVLAACALFLAPGAAWALLGAGFLAVVAAQFGLLAMQSALPSYWDQVWRWGAMYTADTFVPDPIVYGLKQSLNWMGFQAAAVLGTILYFRRRAPGDWRFIGWILLSVLSVSLGLRFFSRYYFQLLPAVALLGARGFVLSGRVLRIAMAALLLVPIVRFGPRYGALTADLVAGRAHQWSDLALAQDSQRVAETLSTASPGASLFVWGYRPDIFALTRMRAATPFLDSQPVSGVIADRHLRDARVSAPEWKERFRNVVPEAHCDYIVDGLGLLNPSLALPPEWLESYSKIGETGASIVYLRRLPR